MKSETDFLVVGAGPGGLAAALWLCRAGADVILVDARDRIGHPARCAEIVGERLFEELDLEPRPGWIRARLESPGKEQWSGRRFTIDRARVEHEVSLVAAGLGAEVVPGTAVVGVDGFDGERRTVELRSRTGVSCVAARCVIAADGVSSLVARMAGVDTFLGPDEVASGLAYMVEDATLAHPRSVYRAPLPRDLAPPPFYYWVAPGGPRSANVGLALPGRDGTRARRCLERMMRDDPACRGGRIVATVAGLLPGRRPMLDPYRDGLLIVGGAARMVNPLSGAGIFFAASSGRAAAEHLDELGGDAATRDRLSGYCDRIGWIYDNLDEAWHQFGQVRRELGMEVS